MTTYLAQNFYHLWGTGLIFDELENLSRKFAEHSFWPEGWIACRKMLNFDREQMPQEVYERLSSLEQVLKPRNLPEQVRALVLSDRQGNLDLEDIELGEPENAEDIENALERADRMALELGSAVALDRAALSELLPELTLGGLRIWYFARDWPEAASIYAQHGKCGRTVAANSGAAPRCSDPKRISCGNVGVQRGIASEFLDGIYSRSCACTFFFLAFKPLFRLMSRALAA